MARSLSGCRCKARDFPVSSISTHPLPRIATPVCSCMKRTCRSNRLGNATSSASNLAINLPRANSMPRFNDRVSPTFDSFRTARTRGSVRPRKYFEVPSVEPSSMIRNSNSVNVCVSTLRTASGKKAASLNVAIKTVTTGGSGMRGAFQARAPGRGGSRQVEVNGPIGWRRRAGVRPARAWANGPVASAPAHPVASASSISALQSPAWNGSARTRAISSRNFAA